MHTVSNSRGDDGYVMKMTAQMPPIGERDSQSVRLQVARGDAWRTIGGQPIDADSRTATFRVAHWPQDRDVPYRLVYTMRATDGSTADHHYEGTVRRQPDDGRLVLAGMTCQYDYGFPYTPLTKNLAALNPDMLYFSGDQIYESNGGFGIVRRPDDRAIVNYLRKQAMFGWAFGDLMRDRPTLCLPDDHDVFHGNLWGEGGAAATSQNSSTAGGYIQSPRFVNVVHRCNTSHHPDRFDPTSAKRNISVYYGDMVYGRVSFALVGDREFKSGPGRVDTGSGRADHVLDPNIDPSTLDRPELTMLGQRQLEFLDHWVEDWRGADMKVLLSETVFANAATHHGSHDNFLFADLDSGGWPMGARDRAIRTVRKAFPLHINGDQHLTTLIQYGVDQQRDSNWSFCTPAITVGYQRWYRADEIGRPYENRPAHGMANTGEYLDGFGNKF
jgi:phosphodiesterase/alkaline phosphatase D-like protein